MLSRLFCIYAVLFVCLTNTAGASATEYAPGEMIVRFTPKTDGSQKTINERNQLLTSFNVGTVKHSSKLVSGLSLIELPQNLKVADAMTLLFPPLLLFCSTAQLLSFDPRLPKHVKLCCKGTYEKTPEFAGLCTFSSFKRVENFFEIFIKKVIRFGLEAHLKHIDGRLFSGKEVYR